MTQQQTPAGKRPYNFSAGPAAMPEAVLQRAASEMLDWHGSGMSVMEMSHRGKEFGSICTQAEADIRTLLAVPSNFHILFMQGGGLGENAIVPLNLSRGKTADFVITGSWSTKSHKEAQRYCTARVAASNADDQHTRLPDPATWQRSAAMPRWSSISRRTSPRAASTGAAWAWPSAAHRRTSARPA